MAGPYHDFFLLSRIEYPFSSYNWSWVGREPNSRGEYERLEFDRDETVETLRRLAAHAKRVAAGDGDLYILHLGV
jgi:hypothetical protein